MSLRVFNDLESIGLVGPLFDCRSDLSGGGNPLTSLEAQKYRVLLDASGIGSFQKGAAINQIGVAGGRH